MGNVCTVIIDKLSSCYSVEDEDVILDDIRKADHVKQP